MLSCADAPSRHVRCTVRRVVCESVLYVRNPCNKTNNLIRTIPIDKLDLHKSGLIKSLIIRINKCQQMKAFVIFVHTDFLMINESISNI